MTTAIQIGEVQAIFRYPVKSMAGHVLERVELGWHGLEGDRRFAFRRVDSKEGLPWLTASRMRQLISYRPSAIFQQNGNPSHVETPDGKRLDIWSEELSTELSLAFGASVELFHLNHGLFDEAPVSIITTATLSALEQEAGRALDVRRFRPNIVIETGNDKALAEDAWIGKSLKFGKTEAGPAIAITMRDVRCSMINLDPETAESDPTVLKAAVRLNGNNAGVYGTVTGIGSVSTGDPVFTAD